MDKSAFENINRAKGWEVGIVVDIVDVKSGKLVFRNFAKGDVIQGVSASTRAARIDQAIADALSPFFQ